MYKSNHFLKLEADVSYDKTKHVKEHLRVGCSKIVHLMYQWISYLKCINALFSDHFYFKIFKLLYYKLRCI